MGKVNLLLLALVVFCALQVVQSQHEARTLFVAMGKAQETYRQLEVAFSRLQLQQVALAKGERIDQVARTRLQMQAPSAGNLVFMTLPEGLKNE